MQEVVHAQAVREDIIAQDLTQAQQFVQTAIGPVLPQQHAV